jgi:hypothetical protein
MIAAVVKQARRINLSLLAWEQKIQREQHDHEIGGRAAFLEKRRRVSVRATRPKVRARRLTAEAERRVV